MAAARWDGHENTAQAMIQFLESRGYEARYYPSNGIDYHATNSIIVITPDAPRPTLTRHVCWAVMFPDGSIKAMTEAEFVAEFEAAHS